MTRVYWPALVAALALSFASAAHASVTVGQLVTPNDDCTGQPITAFQTAVASGSSYVVPTAGVITSWSVQDGATTISDLKLKVGRPAPGGKYTIVGESAAGTQVAGSVNTFPTQIAVKAGDLIGQFADGGDCAVDTGRPGDQVAIAGFDQPLFSTGTYDPGVGLIPIVAKIEPDADGDGFGDETQDQCPANAATHGPCPAPPAAPAVTPPAPAPVAIDAAIAKVLRLSKGGSFTFLLTGSQNTTGTATGTISVPKGAKVVRFKTAKFQLAPGKFTKVTLKLSKSDLRSVRKALKHHRLKAKITVTAGKTVKTLRTTLKR